VRLLALCKLLAKILSKLFYRKTDVLKGDERKEEMMNAPKDRANDKNKDESYGLTKPNS
jgi:hypothetical protein